VPEIARQGQDLYPIIPARQLSQDFLRGITAAVIDKDKLIFK